MASPNPAPRIYEHDATILPHLITHLPHSISLLRRIQHSLVHPSPTAKILCTFPPAATPPPDTPWLAARVDLFRGREIQIVLYSSLEATHTSIDPIVPVTHSDGAGGSTSTPPATDNNKDPHVVSTFTASPALLDLARDQLLALLAYVKAQLLPEYLSSLRTSAEASPQKNNGVPLIPAPDPGAFLIGTLHTGLFALLLRSGVFAHANVDPLPGLRVHRVDFPPYYKYFFRRAVFSPEVDAVPVPLPKGYRYQDRRGRSGVLDEQLDLVQSRTHIPRSRAQLSVMPGVAIYYDGDGDRDERNGEKENENEKDEMPIAWGFLGLDGALATLHVEPEHRGRGLALCLSKEVMRRGMAGGVFAVDDSRNCIRDEEVRSRLGGWVHTEVASYNQASRRVMEKIGGVALTTVSWTVIEVCD